MSGPEGGNRCYIPTRSCESGGLDFQLYSAYFFNLCSTSLTTVIPIVYSRSGSFTVNACFAIFTMYNILINCVSLDREGLLHVHWKPIINYKKNSVASHTNSYNFRNTYVILNSNIILCTNLGLTFEVI